MSARNSAETLAGTTINTGDRIRFTPGPGRKWWDVIGVNEDYIIAITQVPFEPKGTYWYTIVGWSDSSYNGEGPGLIRSSLNALGGGWDFGKTQEEQRLEATKALDALATGEWELSRRRRLGVSGIERAGS